MERQVVLCRFDRVGRMVRVLDLGLCQNCQRDKQLGDRSHFVAESVKDFDVLETLDEFRYHSRC